MASKGVGEHVMSSCKLDITNIADFAVQMGNKL